MLILRQPLCELSIPPLVTVGNRERYSTATAVAFITDKLFVTGAFNSKKLYLIEIQEDNTFKTLQVLQTKVNIDLIDYKNGVIAASGYPFSSSTGYLSIYDLIDNVIVHRKDIPLPNTKAHGVEIIDDYGIIITSNSEQNRGLHFINIDEGKMVQNFNNFKYYPKDAFISGDRILFVCSDTLPQIGQTSIIRESILYLFDLQSLKRIDELHFEGQTDSLTLLGENGFITVQGDDTLVHFSLINDKLTFIKRIPGFNFPHGVDSISNKVAVTNYGDNSIRIFELEELLS